MRNLIKKTFLYKPLAILYDFINFNKKFLHIYLNLYRESKNIDIFFFFPFYHTGGAEIVHLNIVEATKKRKIVIFTDSSANDALLVRFKKECCCFEISDFVKIETSIHYRLLQTFFITKLNKEKKTIFSCHSLFFYKLLPKLNSEIKKIDLLHAFTGTNERGFEKISLPFLKFLTKRVVINNKCKNDLIQLYQIEKIDYKEVDKIIVIQNKVSAFSETLPIKEEPITILYTGRNSLEKRIHLIGEIAKKLHFFNSTIEIVLVGENLIDGIDPLNVKHCIFTGRIDNPKELNNWYKKAHIVLITSSREGFPMSLMEGMSYGAISIATDVGGINEHVINNKTGILISNKLSENDLIDEFVNAIVLLINNKLIFSNLSANAYKHAKNNFSEDKFNLAYNQLLK